jgi:hypothetical protein
MALMMGSLYEALKSANVEDDKARKAAEEAADYQKQISEMRTDLAVLKWMTGLVLAGVVTLIFRAFV